MILTEGYILLMGSENLYVYSTPAFRGQVRPVPLQASGLSKGKETHIATCPWTTAVRAEISDEGVNLMVTEADFPLMSAQGCVSHGSMVMLETLPIGTLSARK